MKVHSEKGCSSLGLLVYGISILVLTSLLEVCGPGLVQIEIEAVFLTAPYPAG
jgi:hypothetical protein